MPKDTDKNSLRNIIKMLCEDPASKLRRDLMNVVLKLTMKKGAHVPDTLTRIRVLPTVSVVGQRDKVERSDVGSTVLKIYVKFLPSEGDVYENVTRLAELIKSLPDIKVVTVQSIDGSPVLYKGSPIVV